MLHSADWEVVQVQQLWLQLQRLLHSAGWQVEMNWRLLLLDWEQPLLVLAVAVHQELLLCLVGLQRCSTKLVESCLGQPLKLQLGSVLPGPPARQLPLLAGWAALLPARRLLCQLHWQQELPPLAHLLSLSVLLCYLRA